MSGLLLICSLAVDYGRVQLAKTQLRSAVDAAAMAAAGELPRGTQAVIDAAVTLASYNQVDGTPVMLNPSTDIKFGVWNAPSRQFTVLNGANRGSANAVQISTSRAISAPFAQIYGGEACVVKASATALYRPGRFAAVGLDFIEMSGNSTDSYSSAGGSVSPYLGSIASNGTIKLSGNSSVKGDAHPGPGKTVIGASRVTGNTSSLPEPLNFPVADPGPVRTINNNASIPSWAMVNGSISLKSGQSITLNAGNYYIKDLSMTAGSTLNVTGPVNLYLWGSLTLHGHAVVAGNLPKNLKLYSVKGPNGEIPGAIDLNSGTSIYAEVYAPLTPITYGGNSSMFGSMVGKSIYMTGNTALHYDVTLRGGVSLVK
ncbi:MAG: hypothetical protein H0U59_02200 [Gemmatimonadaceae bacterium]|nr:hypothetical protein [Gemmatimonadaceae bacterium]